MAVSEYNNNYHVYYTTCFHFRVQLFYLLKNKFTIKHYCHIVSPIYISSIRQEAAASGHCPMSPGFAYVLFVLFTSGCSCLPKDVS